MMRKTMCWGVSLFIILFCCSAGYAQVLPQSGWSLKYVDSEETVAENAAAVNAFDGKANTYWHTRWRGTNEPKHPHEIQIDLGQMYDISGFHYLPIQNQLDGRFGRYEFYVSADGVDWGTAVVSGTFNFNATEKESLFAAKAGRYVRLRVLSEVNNHPYTSVAELNVLGSAYVGNIAPSITSTPVTTATVGQAYSYDVNATGNPVPTYSLTTAPSGMTTNATTGVISWTPSSTGSFPVTVQAANGVGSPALQSFSITVSDGCSRAVNIMPLGDSLTDGFVDIEPQLPPELEVGYRQKLYIDLENSGHFIDFVGSIHNGQSASPAFDTDHEGHDGIWSNDVSANIFQWLGNQEAAGHPVDIVLLHIGTNDLYNSVPRATVVNNIATALDAIDNYSRNITVVLARIINFQSPSSAVTQFNNDLATMANNRVTTLGDKIILSNMESALTYPTDFSGILHPTQTGYEKMAGVWLTALNSFLPVCQQVAPLITSTPVTTATVGQAYSYDVNATGNPAPTYSLTTAPTGMTINATTGVVSWTPSSTGSFSVTVHAANGVGSPAIQSFSVTVAEGPSITSTPVTTATVGQVYSYDVNATGNPAPTYSLVTAPSGMTINATTGVISWTPTASGSYAVTVKATNAAGSATQSFSIAVNQSPSITSTPVTTATVGQAYSYDVNATGNPALTYSLVTAPAGMTINATTGVISWTPSSTGSFPVTVQAANGVGSPALQSFSIQVSDTPPVPVVLPRTNWSLKYVDSEETVAENAAAVNAFDGKANTYWHTLWHGSNEPGHPHEIQIDLGQLYMISGFRYLPIQNQQDGRFGQYEFYVSADGVDWGAPVVNGTFNFNATEKESLFSAKAGRYVRLRVLSEVNNHPYTSVAELNVLGSAYVGNIAPSITSTPVTTATVGQAYSYDVNATGNPVPTYSLVTAPSGMTINATTGVISWTPSSTGSFSVTVQAANGVGSPALQSFSVTVAEGPSITSTPVTTATVGQVYSYDVNATGNPAPTYSLVTAPSGMTINATTGVISWTPTASGSYAVTVKATNSDGTVTQSFNITVNQSPSITSTPVSTATVGQVYSYDVNATGNPAPTYSLVTAPTGMTINATTGVISWTPSSTGNFPMTVQAANGVGSPALQSFSIQVSDTPPVPVVLPRANWSLKYVDSEETVAENAAAVNAFDGKANTYWHTQWFVPNEPTHPHEIQIDIGQLYIISGFRYLPIQNQLDGRFGQYEFYVSADGVDWGTAVASGTFNFNATEKESLFEPKAGRYIRLRVLSEVNNHPYTSVAELNVLGYTHSGNFAPGAQIDSPKLSYMQIVTGDQINFTGTGVDADNNLPVSYLWHFGEGSGIPDSILRDPGLVQFNIPGTYTVTMSVTDALGLSDPTPATRTIEVVLPEFFSHLVPNWTLVPYAPFPLMPAPGIVQPVLTAGNVTDVSNVDFVADPFLFHENGQWYMFFEVAAGYGRIALAKSTDGLHWTYDRVVLDNGIHLSYPDVFKYDNRYYMVPESAKRNGVFVFEAANFPYEWHEVATLISGKAFNDPAIIRYNNTWWMFVEADWSTHLYYSDNLLSGWTLHPKSPIVYNDQTKSVGGGRTFVYDNGRVIRVAQKDDYFYGEAVRAFAVDVLTKTDYAEHEIPESPILNRSGSGWNHDGMHHFDPWWTGDRWLCSVDGVSGGIFSIGIYVTEGLQ